MCHEGYDRSIDGRDDGYESRELCLQNAISEIFLQNNKNLNLKQNLVSQHYLTNKQIKVLC